MHLDDVVGWGKPEVFTDTYECQDWDMVYLTVKENQQIHSKHRWALIFINLPISH